MPSAVYVLCAVTSLVCAVLLLRQYARRRTRLLLWAGLCFVGLTVNNVLLWLDFVAYPTADLSIVRGATAVLSVMILLHGLIWDRR
jgi:hypothetical protein